MQITERQQRRWDIIVKVTHWGVVAVVICNSLLVGEGSIAHIYAGYFLAALVSIRILWGWIGPRSARFASFPPSPKAAFAHIRAVRERRREVHVSHNPLGALMAYTLWACLAAIIASGIAMAGPPPAIKAPVDFAQLVSEEGREAGEDEEHGEYSEQGRYEDGENEYEESESEEWLEEVHETAVNILYLLILLHIAGVAFETLRSGRRTLTAMLPGGR